MKFYKSELIKLKVRMAESKDIKNVMKLLEQVLAIHNNGRPDLFKANSTKYTENQLKDIFEDKNTPVFVAVDENDNVIGYAFCVFQRHLNNNILTDIKTLYIDDLCVDENVRGLHVGRKLYDEVVCFAKQNDCYNITLNVWACNESAIKFYERCGFMPQKIGMEVIIKNI